MSENGPGKEKGGGGLEWEERSVYETSILEAANTCLTLPWPWPL